jgi:hypothetical protein
VHVLRRRSSALRRRRSRVVRMSDMVRRRRLSLSMC